MNFLHEEKEKVKPGQKFDWECKICKDAGLNVRRGCPDYKGIKKKSEPIEDPAAKLFKSFSFKKKKPEEQKKRVLYDLGGGFTADECLSQKFSSKVIRLVSLIRWSESMKLLPSEGGLMDQSNYFYEVREVVVSEEAAIIDELRKKEKSKPSPKSSSAPSGRRGSLKGKR
jgi:hypothetical protein